MTRWSGSIAKVALAAGLLAPLSGCKTTAKHDNPVLIPPPRRVTMDDTEVEQRLAQAAEKDPGKIRQTAATVGDVNPGDDTEVYNARVVARVNGAPVFAGEVLDKYGDYLRKAKEQLPPEDYAKLREAIITRDLRSHIERRLLVERMKAKLKPEQVKMLDEHIDRLFNERVEELKKELKVATRTELELALNERGTTLGSVRDAFATERLSLEYLFSSIERPPAPTRPEMVAYYQQHLKDYEIPARVKWQEIQVSVGRQTRSQAEAKIKAAQQELAAGTPFEQVAKKFSDGPTASSGGVWDWARRGSLADQELEKILFDLPVGRNSDIYFGRGAFHIVRTLEREEAGRTPFGDVQAQIEKKIEHEREKDLPKQFVEKLYSEAVIESDYPLGE